jgi:ABC-type molybdate transport system substrate-binding protein
MKQKRRSVLISLGMIALALAITFAPLPGVQRQIIVVSGTELLQPLTTLKQRFEQAQSNIKVRLEFQGSQDLINNFIDQKNTFAPTVLIPANGEFLQELQERWQAQNLGEPPGGPFYDPPRPLVQTQLVGIAWPERGKVLFQDGKFNWSRLEQALRADNWQQLGGNPAWGSFDLVLTDTARSNSAQLALYLWAGHKLGTATPDTRQLDQPTISDLFSLIKRSVYQPPRSTDVLLQEFITRGPNDADVAVVYESSALSRWQQSQATQGKPYQIYYLDQTIVTASTAAIPRRDVDNGSAEAARKFLDFLLQPPQQEVFVQQGFRPTQAGIDVAKVAGSPWQQNIPGAAVQPPSKVIPTPKRDTLAEIIRLWQRAKV